VQSLTVQVKHQAYSTGTSINLRVLHSQLQKAPTNNSVEFSQREPDGVGAVGGSGGEYAQLLSPQTRGRHFRLGEALTARAVVMEYEHKPEKGK
jgi:predicted alternative tryptophan synthase beta-subunit